MLGMGLLGLRGRNIFVGGRGGFGEEFGRAGVMVGRFWWFGFANVARDC